MIKPKPLVKGDKVAVVSISSGILGEDFAKHELDLGLNRIKEFGLVPIVMPNALRGIEYLKNHPEARAQDLKDAFYDKVDEYWSEDFWDSYNIIEPTESLENAVHKLKKQSR